jgi:FKBP-type peptidyl-prolyl cis-trans isomerase FkpA
MMKFAAIIFGSLLALAIANAQDSAPTPAAPAKAKTTAKEAAKDKKAVKETGKETAKEDNLPKDVKRLIMHDTVVGTGKVATKGKKIKVNYTGWLYDPSQQMGRGKQFDTSIGREPFAFNLGGGEVIKGWDDGFENMKVGGKRKLIIPSDMGYGVRGAGNAIPPNAPLMFEVELLEVM